MNDSRPLWMKLATLRNDACISAHYSASVIRFMRDWLTAIAEFSAAEGYPLCLIDVAIGQLEDDLAEAREAIASGDWMPEPAPFHEPKE